MEGGGGAESAGEGYGELVSELVSGDLEGGRQARRERGDYLELIF